VTIIIPSYQEPEVHLTLLWLKGVCWGLPVAYHVEDDWGSGVGATLRRGVERATTPWVLFAMADGSENPLDVARMIETLQTNRWDAVFGNRWGPDGGVVGYPPLKRLANRLGNCGIALATGCFWYQDWTDLAKAYRRDLLLQLQWSADFRCAVEIPLRYTRRWPQFAVVPMHWQERSAGRSSYTVGQALKVLGTAVREVW
jgi:glycosyltransferase involved in cell wall biosynthesis